MVSRVQEQQDLGAELSPPVNASGPAAAMAMAVAVAGSKWRFAAVSVCLLVVMAMVAESSAAGVCDPNALYPCLRAIQGARPPPPSAQCCMVVRRANKNCMCAQLRSSSFPAQMVNNGLRLPKKCGRTDLGGFRCGRYTFPK